MPRDLQSAVPIVGSPPTAHRRRVHLGFAVPLIVLLSVSLILAIVALAANLVGLAGVGASVARASSDLAELTSTETELRESLQDMRDMRISDQKRLTAEDWTAAPGGSLRGIYFKYPENYQEYVDKHCDSTCVVVLVRTDSQRQCPSGVSVSAKTWDRASLAEVLEGKESQAIGTWAGSSSPLGPDSSAVVVLSPQSGESSGGVEVSKIGCN